MDIEWQWYGMFRYFKAFDAVSHKILLVECETQGIRGPALFFMFVFAL